MADRPLIEPRPDFGRFLDTLLLRRAWKRPPMFDFMMRDDLHCSWVLGRPVQGAADAVEGRKGVTTD
jgi:hypothetical protein